MTYGFRLYQPSPDIRYVPAYLSVCNERGITLTDLHYGLTLTGTLECESSESLLVLEKIRNVINSPDFPNHHLSPGDILVLTNSRQRRAAYFCEFHAAVLLPDSAFPLLELSTG